MIVADRPIAAVIELPFSHGWETINAILERKARLLERARRHVQLGLDASDLYRTVVTLDEAEETIRHAFGLETPLDVAPGVLTEEWGK